MFGSTRRQTEQNDPAGALVREVGIQLRQARMARGEELEHVAENLRIRPAYLRGLEQGDLSVMPGRAYALGFLRSYAQYLGFDGDDLIAQIRSSVAGLTSRTHLHDRTPLAESRLPKLPILVISLAALAGIYAGWAYVDDSGPAEVELVAEVPDELRQQTPAPDITPATAPAPEPATAPAAAPAIEPLVGPPVEPQADAPASSAAQEVEQSADPAADRPSTDTADPSPQAAEDSTVESAPQPEPSAPAVAAEPPSNAEALAPSAPPASTQIDTESAAPAADVLAAVEPVAAGTAPTVYRGGDAASRVMLRARTSAWVHVSSTNNDYLWVKTLQPGDAFLVPDRPDLVLWTGNAGGIEVIVDGASLPPLGPEARVVRDVPLQADDLLRRLQPAPAADAASQHGSR
jgi:cytoskeleton protein RodZ